jgi:endonuclease/exonuclease/phosphatase family metal-dependent hydrolase
LTSLVVASYNVHECRGQGPQRRPERVAAVLGELGADIAALQEVHSVLPEGQPGHQASWLARATGMTLVDGWTLSRDGGRFGNALLTSLPVLEAKRHDISLPGREPRGALEVTLGGPLRLRVIATHLGLSRAERRVQSEALLGLLSGEAPALLLGDLNEPTPWGPVSRRLRRRLPRMGAPASFPVRWPLLALDRIVASEQLSLLEVRALRSPAARRASDHLPVRGRIEVAQDPGQRSGR